MEGLWLAVAVVVPLAINPWGTNAFELPKILLLRLVAILMALVAVGRVFGGWTWSNGQGRRTLLALLGPALLLGLVAAVATLFSVDQRASLWGSYERQQGLLATAAYR